MACFVVSAAEAVAVAAAKKGFEKKEMHEKENKLVIPMSRKLRWLGNMLWGGSALLAFEHVWHGEVVPWFPFLTAMSNAEDAAEMFREMSTVGVGMAVLVTGVWALICLGADSIIKRSDALPDGGKA